MTCSSALHDVIELSEVTFLLTPKSWPMLIPASFFSLIQHVEDPSEHPS